MLKKLLLFTLLITTPILAYAEWGQRLTDAFDVDKTAPTDTQALLWGSTNEIWAPGDVVTPTSGALTYLKLNQTTPQTITGGAPNFSSAIDFTQIATPANPPAGSNRLYFKNDDKLYQLTSGGSESLVGGGGGSSVSFGSAGQIPYTNATTDDFSYGTGLSWNPATSTLTATNITGDLTGNVTGNVSGNASTATSASSAASATNAANTAITDDTTTNAIMYPTWVTANTGNLPQKVSSTKLSFNPSSGLLTATGFSGPLTGNVTGNVSGNAGTVTNGVYTTDAGTVFLAPNGDGQNLSNVIHSESDPLSATKALDNIASCAINTSLLSDTADTDSLGSADKEWLNLYIGDAGKIYLGLGQDTSIHRSGANEMTLTASSGVKATNFISTASLGTSPYACTSNTLNTNLNADLLDGQHGTYYAVATDYLKLDQSTPQTVTGGAPNFSGGLDSGSSVNITGSADTVQLKVKANNPQVNDILQVLASDGTTKQFAIDGSGNLLFKTGQDIRPTSDSTTAINIAQADGTDWVTFDTTNKKIGINTTPTYKIDLRSDGIDVDSDFSISNSDYSHFIRLFPGRQNDPNPFILWKNGDPMRFVNDSGGWNELGRFSASGNLLVGTTDDDGTPATGKLVVKGSTNDGSTNVQVWRDSDEANVATLDTDGNFSGNKYTSSVAIGTQPYACTSTTVNTNLNADLLDGQHGSYYQTAITGTDTHVMFFDGANNPAGEAGMTYNKTTNALTLAGTLTVKGTTNDGSTNIFVGRDSDEANVATLDSNGNITMGDNAVDTLTLTFNALTSDGVITWHGDTGLFDMACGLRVANGTTDTSGIVPIISTDILAWTFDASHNLWAVMADGLYKSTDYGVTFVAADTGLGTTQTFSSVLVATNGYIYWCPQNYGKIRRSVDAGVTFGDVASYTASGFGGWSLTEDNLGYIYMGIYSTPGNNQQKILRSTDNGANWTTSYNGGGWHIHDVAADPFQAGYIYATCDPGAVGGETWKIIRSVDNGANWTTIDEGSSYIKINFLPGMRIFGADDVNGTIVKTTDDDNFTTLYQAGTSVVSFATARIGSTIYFGQVRSGGATGIGQLVSTDGSYTRVEWQGTDTTAWSGILGLAVDGTTLYAATAGADSSFKLYPSTVLNTRRIKNDGDIVIAPDTKGVMIDGGLNIGSTLLAGDNNLRVEGTSLFIGHITAEGVTSTGATGTGKFVFDTSPTIVTPTITTSAKCPLIFPPSDSTTAFKITKADAKTAILTVDTSNSRVGINATPVAGYDFQVGTPAGAARDAWISADDGTGHGLFVGYDNTYRTRITEKSINCYNNDLTIYADGKITISHPFYLSGLGAAGTGTTLVIDANKQVIPLTSSKEFKKDITDLDFNSADIYKLRPVSFVWKADGSKDFGLIAEDTYEVLPQLVNLDTDGNPYSVKYYTLSVLLLDQMKKQQKEIDTLKARLDKLEQATEEKGE